jgi:Golgi SNAP receptor complex protein 1
MLTGPTLQAMDSLQREMEHTRNSERLIDEQISIALETRESLVSQREVLKLVQTKLNDLTNKFPMINNLVNKINFRKRRDTIILGVVIGLCLVFMLWYMFA